MDNHPIPQDVTNFQFKLIGDLTLKQFGYLIGGIIGTWLIFLLPVFFLFKLPLAGVVLGLGVILAFVPFEGRPSDVMFFHFFKALFTPNQYNYQAGSTQQTHVDNTPPSVKKEEKPPAPNATVFFQSSPVPIAPIQQQPIQGPAFSNPTQAPVTKPVQEDKKEVAAQPATLATEEATLEKELTEAKAQEAKEQAGSEAANLAHQKVQELETELHEVFLQKQDLEKQILQLKEQLAQKQSQQVFTPSDAPEQPKETTHVIKIPKQMGKSVGLPITPDVPNLLTGIVKDPRENVLPGILIEVKDKDGNAVRAFKTNNLGQFASATPLLNGVYTVSFEDPQTKHSFDLVEITASGDILTPIEVISVDQREKLRQELFGA